MADTAKYDTAEERLAVTGTVHALVPTHVLRLSEMPLALLTAVLIHFSLVRGWASTSYTSVVLVPSSG